MYPELSGLLAVEHAPRRAVLTSRAMVASPSLRKRPPVTVTVTVADAPAVSHSESGHRPGYPVRLAIGDGTSSEDG